jgi:Uma2 family endonuclease
MSPAEYLERERKAEFKSEYFEGEMHAMAGANCRHALIVTNLAGELRQRLKKGPCKVYSSDLRLRVSPTGLYTYPDVTVVVATFSSRMIKRTRPSSPILIKVFSFPLLAASSRSRRFTTKSTSLVPPSPCPHRRPKN